MIEAALTGAMVACSSLELVLALAVVVVVAVPVAPAQPGAFTTPRPPTSAIAGNRTQWMLDLTYHGAQLTAVWPPLSEAWSLGE